jgi:hypothetical protein
MPLEEVLERDPQLTQGMPEVLLPEQGQRMEQLLAVVGLPIEEAAEAVAAVESSQTPKGEQAVRVLL